MGNFTLIERDIEHVACNGDGMDSADQSQGGEFVAVAGEDSTAYTENATTVETKRVIGGDDRASTFAQSARDSKSAAIIGTDQAETRQQRAKTSPDAPTAPPPPPPTENKKQNIPKEALSTDDVLPLVVYVIVRAAPHNMYTNISYMQALRPSSAVLADAAYLDFTMATLQAALEFILTTPLGTAADEQASMPGDGESSDEQDPLGVSRFARARGKTTSSLSVPTAQGDAKSKGRKQRRVSARISRDRSPRRYVLPSRNADSSGRRAGFGASTSGGRRRATFLHSKPKKSMLLGDSSGSAEVQAGREVLEGYLHKRGWFSRTFRQRYFVLCLPAPSNPSHVPYLTYYLSRGHGKPKGTIPLPEGKVDLMIGERKTFEVKLATRKSLVFRANSAESAEKWVSTLRPLLTKTVQDALRALKKRMDDFGITLDEYTRVLGDIAEGKVMSTGSGANLLEMLAKESQRREAASLRKWAMKAAGEVSAGEEVIALTEMAEVLGKHLAGGRITQADYDDIVKDATEKMFSTEKNQAEQDARSDAPETDAKQTEAPQADEKAPLGSPLPEKGDTDARPPPVSVSTQPVQSREAASPKSGNSDVLEAKALSREASESALPPIEPQDDPQPSAKKSMLV